MIKYIHTILSKNKRKTRVSFYFPWIGIFIGSIFLFLIDGIMVGMENKIFSKINQYTDGYKIENLDEGEFDDFKFFLENNEISYRLESNRDVVLSYNENYSIVKLVIDENSLEGNGLKIGRGLSVDLGLKEGDMISILSPLDISLHTMNIPIKDFLVTSIYEVPVVEFDKLYVYGNDANFNKQMNLNTYFVIDGNTSNKKKNLIKNNFSDIEIHYWANKYKELSSAIELEKYMYKAFAFLLILISCLGVFTISNHTILNKSKNFAILNVFGVNNRLLRSSMYYLMLGSTIFCTSMAFIATKILVSFNILDPMIGYLFPSELFYDFSIQINYMNVIYVMILNIISIILSIYIPLKIIDSNSTVSILNKRL